MSNTPLLAIFALTLLAAPQGAPALKADRPSVCDSCARWNAKREPVRLFGNTYYVGVAELSAVLITSDSGHILLDGGLPQSAPLIDENIRALGFKTADIRLIVGSHEHFDHVGGIAALQRASGAEVAASPAMASALERGEPTTQDPQYENGRAFNAFAPVAKVRRVADGETIRVGALAITAHHTPGHTPGGTSWSWRSCEGTRCVDVVYADSLNPVSSDGFRFTGDATHPSLVESFRRSIAKIAALPCDVIISVHPAFSGLDEKIARRRTAPTPDPVIDPNGCRAYAADATSRLDKRVQEERTTKLPLRP